ncbi:MAG: hypothetical protein ACPGN3_15650 [Opitutales bacterium]
MKRKYSISAKIGFVTFILVGAFASTVAINVQNSRSQSTELDVVANAMVPAALEAQSAAYNYEKTLKLFEEAVLNGEESNLDLVDEQCSIVAEKLIHLSNRLQDVNEGVSHIVAAADDAKLYAGEARTLFNLLSEKGFGDPEVTEAFTALNTLGESTTQSLSEIRELTVKNTQGQLESINQTAESLWKLGLGIFFGSLLVSMVFTIFLVRSSIVKPLLKNSIGLDERTVDIRNAADHFKHASEAISAGAHKSAMLLEESSSALSQMTSLTESNAERAMNTKKMAQDAR